MLAYARFEIVRTLRSVRYLVLVAGLPVVLELLFGSRTHADFHDGGVTFAVFYATAMVAWAAMGAAINASGFRLAAERAAGWLRQLRITPLSDSAWLGGKLAQALFLVIPAATLVVLAAVTIGGAHLAAGRWLGLLVVALVGAIPFAFLGLVIGQGVDAEAAQAAQIVCVLVLLFLGGVFVPLSELPAALRTVAWILPSSHLMEIEREVAAGQAPGLVHVGALAGWTGALGLAAARLRRRGAAETV